MAIGRNGTAAAQHATRLCMRAVHLCTYMRLCMRAVHLCTYVRCIYARICVLLCTYAARLCMRAMHLCTYAMHLCTYATRLCTYVHLCTYVCTSMRACCACACVDVPDYAVRLLVDIASEWGARDRPCAVCSRGGCAESDVSATTGSR